MEVVTVEPISKSADARDELTALKDAAIKRIRDCAWAAKLAVEAIGNDGACNAKTKIELARKHLSDAERHFNALLDYEAAYRRAVAESPSSAKRAVTSAASAAQKD